MANETSETCGVVTGLLVPRPCGESARDMCARCRVLACVSHLKATDSGLVCLHCAEGKAPPALTLDVPADLAFRPEDVTAFEEARPPRHAPNVWSDLT